MEEEICLMLEVTTGLTFLRFPIPPFKGDVLLTEDGVDVEVMGVLGDEREDFAEGLLAPPPDEADRPLRLELSGVPGLEVDLGECNGFPKEGPFREEEVAGDPLPLRGSTDLDDEDPDRDALRD